MLLIKHQPQFKSTNYPKQNFINKPYVLYAPRLQIAHFVSVFTATTIVIGGTLLFGAFIGDVTTNSDPPQVGIHAILLGMIHTVLLYIAFNTRALELLDIRVNPYITLADCFFHRAIGVVPCLIELLAQGLGATTGTALIYGFISNSPALTQGVGGTVINTTVGWALGSAIFCGTIIGWSYFHNYYHRRSDNNAMHMANAVGLSVALFFPFGGPTTQNPLRWLGACVIEGTCGAHGSWIYPVGPAIGIMFVGYLIHLVSWKIQPTDGDELK